jgi:hypothetical protein
MACEFHLKITQHGHHHCFFGMLTNPEEKLPDRTDARRKMR